MFRQINLRYLSQARPLPQAEGPAERFGALIGDLAFEVFRWLFSSSMASDRRCRLDVAGSLIRPR
jgi:hypothetical protein